MISKFGQQAIDKYLNHQEELLWFLLLQFLDTFMEKCWLSFVSPTAANYKWVSKAVSIDDSDHCYTTLTNIFKEKNVNYHSLCKQEILSSSSWMKLSLSCHYHSDQHYHRIGLSTNLLTHFKMSSTELFKIHFCVRANNQTSFSVWMFLFPINVLKINTSKESMTGQNTSGGCFILHFTMLQRKYYIKTWNWLFYYWITVMVMT